MGGGGNRSPPVSPDLSPGSVLHFLSVRVPAEVPLPQGAGVRGELRAVEELRRSAQPHRPGSFRSPRRPVRCGPPWAEGCSARPQKRRGRPRPRVRTPKRFRHGPRSPARLRVHQWPVPCIRMRMSQSVEVAWSLSSSAALRSCANHAHSGQPGTGRGRGRKGAIPGVFLSLSGFRLHRAAPLLIASEVDGTTLGSGESTQLRSCTSLHGDYPRDVIASEIRARAAAPWTAILDSCENAFA